MQAIYALHRGNTTREQEVKSKQNSNSRGHPYTNPRATSRDRVESGIQEHNSYEDNHRRPSATVHRIGLLFPFAPVQAVKIPSLDQVLALFEDNLGQIHRPRTNIMEGTRITPPGS